MMSKTLRERLTYAVMSALVVWHTLAMVIATAPESALTVAARWLFQPYLSLLRLDNEWSFFAPNTPQGQQFRYVIEDSDGKQHTFIPDQKLNRFHPIMIWVRDHYKTVMQDPELHADPVGAALCRDHADMHPVSVTLVQVDQGPFLPEDQMNGKHPLDPEFVTETALKTVPCPHP